MWSQVAWQQQKMEENIFGAHALNVELKKQNLRDTKSAPSRRGHFGYGSINWDRAFARTWNTMAWQKSC